jgi:MFS family permease
VLTFT